MSPEIANAAMTCLADGAHSLVAMYTNTALTLNACDVAAKSYASRTDNLFLSTTAQIPEEFRLPVELDVRFSRHELSERYSAEVAQRICEDFLIRLISLLDGIFEDLLAVVTALNEPAISEIEVARRVRAAWTQEPNGHVKLVNYLLSMGLKPPSGKKSTVEMVFDRYYEMREVRHALIHNAGNLSNKHLKRLKELSERLPVELRDGSLASAEFLAKGRVVLNLQEILSFRFWAYSTVLGYLRAAFKGSIVCEQ